MMIMKAYVRRKKAASATSKVVMIENLKDQNLYSDYILRKSLAWLLDEYIRPFDRNLNHLGKLYN